MKTSHKEATRSRHKRIRRKLSGTPERPRLSVFRSNKHIVVQIIDDANQHTLVAASTLESELKTSLSSTANCEASAKVGELIAQRAIAKGISQVVFDRGGNLYHGRIEALAEAARASGLVF
ncbi:ribosomal protein L18, bacterial type [Synechococcus sp. PCC 7502]|uniref:50S ribosomal protein L18 n=1 Tax=Synechococcus sp. PCC 7502 TaxID=1173263 RepID=UPI00029FEF10|nr:50S ribosomal protein L18 [Synechococcus sp. PCC 7502]AFY72914.1 ribosomal protein L18, bacterial type [Synechococcus sp. PCC 7502]